MVRALHGLLHRRVDVRLLTQNLMVRCGIGSVLRHEGRPSLRRGFALEVALQGRAHCFFKANIKLLRDDQYWTLVCRPAEMRSCAVVSSTTNVEIDAVTPLSGAATGGTCPLTINSIWVLFPLLS